MKIISLGLIIFSFAIVSIAQTSVKAKTDLESFQEKYGTVIIKSYTNAGTIRGQSGLLEISALEHRSASSALKVKGLVIEINSGERFSSSAKSFIEFGEIDSLLKGIEFISKIDSSVTPLTHFEARYQTKDDFAVTVFNGLDGKLSVSVRSGSVGSKAIFLKVEQLPELVEKIKQAKTLVDAL